ncbi:MAG: bifunctional phosphoribosylaminoimidazolecarboxamide formyltransferase/IMP cyclohydrolase [Chitinispirillia bacterium]|nr:bifunctional phosphoribosylaminoimidazolecarboxamide formyltransferase/IMP cyclohydrolase [Chitinispirillia bacterium]MCL2241782.1 bifunctional phosphoribosylaminoimidazolecarboxamide formyltransferase/IMP cyclohydrolase [Chitinispirillia bacterium]
MEDGLIAVKRALISVSDKAGVVDFARALSSRGVEILSTGGTCKLLSDNGVPVTAVDAYTGHPEIMDGRVKTLHPKVHGGILAVRDNPRHVKEMEECGIGAIDMVVVNLYPFERTVAGGAGVEEAIENIDIGGPAMVRSSAKNHAFVAVVVDPADYRVIEAELSSNNGAVGLDTRKRLAVKAFRHTSAYDAAINAYLSKIYLEEEVLQLYYGGGEVLRYGENPHQSAVFYRDGRVAEASMATAELLGGKELSYNNIVDGDAALEAVKELSGEPAASVIKHMNPCGYATGKTVAQALEAAWSGDTVSAFGSVIAVTRAVDIEAAKVLAGRFVELLIAPDFSDEALEYLKQKSSSLRILKTGGLSVPGSGGSLAEDKYVLKYVTGGMLRQGRDAAVFDKWETVTKARFPANREALAVFANRACKHVKSNAIVLAQEYLDGLNRIVGMGAGQPNRVDSLRKLAVTKAAENIRMDYGKRGEAVPQGTLPEFAELVMASDAFFPFADTVDEANAAGIRYIVQPGGSKRDNEVIEACDKYGIAMVFTGMRHFRH